MLFGMIMTGLAFFIGCESLLTAFLNKERVNCVAGVDRFVDGVRQAVWVWFLEHVLQVSQCFVKYESSCTSDKNMHGFGCLPRKTAHKALRLKSFRSSP